jgi:hypothetical protein
MALLLQKPLAANRPTDNRGVRDASPNFIGTNRPRPDRIDDPSIPLLPNMRQENTGSSSMWRPELALGNLMRKTSIAHTHADVTPILFHEHQG